MRNLGTDELFKDKSPYGFIQTHGVPWFAEAKPQSHVPSKRLVAAYKPLAHTLKIIITHHQYCMGACIWTQRENPIGPFGCQAWPAAIETEFPPPARVTMVTGNKITGLQAGQLYPSNRAGYKKIFTHLPTRSHTLTCSHRIGGGLGCWFLNTWELSREQTFWGPNSSKRGSISLLL